jgi:hypothetical protein
VNQVGTDQSSFEIVECCRCHRGLHSRELLFERANIPYSASEVKGKVTMYESTIQ